MSRIRTIIMGAAGRDFHNFNTYYRDNDKYEVVAFTDPDPKYRRSQVSKRIGRNAVSQRHRHLSRV